MVNQVKFEVVEREYVTEVLIQEGNTYDDGTPRATLKVDVYPPREAFGRMEGATVSWPSTSDKRPILAIYLSKALRMAYGIAVVMNQDAEVEDPEINALLGE